MALLWCDGFGNVDGEVEGSVYDAGSGPEWVFSSTGGRNGRGMVRGDYTYTNSLKKTLGANGATLVVGVAINFEIYASLRDMINLYDGGTKQMSFYAYCADGSNYVIRAYNGDGTYLGVGTVPIPGNQWRYLELKVLFSATIGTVEVRVDGDTHLLLTGQDTINSANSYANLVELKTFGSERSYFSDYYILDGTGSTNNDFLGDVKVDTYLPNSDGTYEDFTCQTGTDMFTMLDEINPDDNSTYIESSTVGHQYTVGQATPTDGTEIYGVMLRQKVKNTDAGTMKVKQLLRNNATDSLGTEYTLSTSWSYLHGVYETDPSDSSAWVDADFSTAEFGIEITA